MSPDLSPLLLCRVECEVLSQLTESEVRGGETISYILGPYSSYYPTPREARANWASPSSFWNKLDRDGYLCSGQEIQSESFSKVTVLEEQRVRRRETVVKEESSFQPRAQQRGWLGIWQREGRQA